MRVQGASSGSGQQPPHMLQQADGSMQAVPRIVIRSAAAPAAPHGSSIAPEPQHSPNSQQYPVVLNSRVVRESTSEPPPSHAAPPNSYAHWVPAHQQREQLPRAQYGMHRYQQQQQPVAHAQQAQAYVQQPPGAHVVHAQQQQQQQQPQQLLYASRQPLQPQLPQQPLQQLPQQLPPHQQGQTQEPQPRPGSFQELLSAPVLSEEYNSVPATHDPAPGLVPEPATRTHQAQPLPAAQPAAIYSSQVLLRQPAGNDGSVADTAQFALRNPGNPGLDTVPTSQHMQVQQSGNAIQHHLRLAASSQMLMQTSSAMYPPVQYPQSAGAYPALPKTSTGPLQGHPYHGYYPNQPAGAATGAQQPQQQQQQAFQSYPQARVRTANLPLQSAMHDNPPVQATPLADPRNLHHRPIVSAALALPGHPQMARVQIGNVTYDPPQMVDLRHAPVSPTAASYQTSAGNSQYPGHAGRHGVSQGLDCNPQQTSASLQHSHPVQTAPASNPPGVYHQSQHRADVEGRAHGAGGVPWGSLQGVIPGPAYVAVRQANSRPAGSAGPSANESGELHPCTQVCMHSNNLDCRFANYQTFLL